VLHRFGRSADKPRREADVSRARRVLIPRAALLVLGASVAQATSSERMTGNASEGHIVYQGFCELFHGTNGYRDGSLGKAFVPPLVDLSTSDIQSKSERDLRHTIFKGKASAGMSVSLSNSQTGKHAMFLPLGEARLPGEEAPRTCTRKSQTNERQTDLQSDGHRTYPKVGG
jgi:hypothetical protein